MKTVIVTGGAGFIGSNLIRYLIKNTEYKIINIDNLTYAGNLISLRDIEKCDKYAFEKADICDKREMHRLFTFYKPDYVFHLAAESHVDRSIDGPGEFINTNIVGTYNLLSSAYEMWKNSDDSFKANFRFLHVSTDEVFGTLGSTGFFTEETAYDPRSPYSASKASSDHLVRAWYHTFGLPVLITNCSNNYGPYQFPEKLIPVVIINAIKNKPIPVYGKGDNIRDWLYVEDHVHALKEVIEKGKLGETYVIGGRNERTNLELVLSICRILDKLQPREMKYEDLITYVQDRPGHDKRYAIDPKKIQTELSFKPNHTFESGIKHTVAWYLQNMEWCETVTKQKYNFERLGSIK